MSKKTSKTEVPFNAAIKESLEIASEDALRTEAYNLVDKIVEIKKEIVDIMDKKGGDIMEKKAKVFKIADVLNGTADVPSGHAEKGESAALRTAAAKILPAVGDCMLLSEFVKSFYKRFTRDEYNYARQVFMTRGGSFAIKKAHISGDTRERSFLVRVK